MPLFQTSVLNKYLAEQDKEVLLAQYNIFKSYFLNPTIQNNILAQKEEQFQEGFLRELFVKVLGYTINPEPAFNLTTELKNVKDAKKADGAIINNEKVLAVIELKGTDTTNLTKIEQQAFNYKNNQDGCRYVITSNFQKLRFYIDNAIEYIEWDLFKLDSEGFALLYLCLAKANVYNDLPAKIKTESVTVEEQVTKQLYKEYSQFRKSLFTNIVELNTQYNKLELFKKTQKLLDRFLFLFFAEDRLLVPPNSVRMILEQWTELKEKFDEYQPLYDRFKKYFGYLNTGYAGKQHEIFAYNGGLFATDDILDNIKIDDTVLYNATLGLSNYDYNSEVDVNILGHIFEHSLTEIEELEQEINSPSHTGEGLGVRSKRKKDGVFYTPKYITKYIVENTVGTLCKNKKEELNLQEEDYHQLTKKAKKQLYEKLMQYKEWLLHITIIDPACGSGAFLNQALEFLIAEHKGIAELEANIFNTPMVLTDVESSILENNLFGVDINEESVEIAKLSLWLRTARKGRKLNSLNNNIKCGNSLIDDPAVAGDKAFNWQEQFPSIFEKGGFDVVIGNPPYVVLPPEELVKYTFANKNNNTYVAFIELGLRIIKYKCKLSYIIPNTWFSGDNYLECRNILLTKYSIEELIQLPYDIFNAYIDTSIVTILNSNSNVSSCNIYKYNERHKSSYIDIDKFEKIEIKYWIELGKIFLSNSLDKIFKKVWSSEINLKLKNIAKVNRGCLPPKENELSLNLDDVYNIEWFDGQVYRYQVDEKPKCYVNYDSLRENKLIEVYNSEKILARQLMSRQFRMNLTYFNRKSAFKKNLYAIYDLKKEINYLYLLSFLNSKLFSFCQLNFNSSLQRDDFPAFSLNDFKEFLIPSININSQQPFIEKANIMLSKNIELLQTNSQFQKLLTSKFEGININTKLVKWYELSFADFNKELTKQKIKLSLQEQSEWLTFFEQEKQKAQAIKTEIDTTDAAIDQMVYALYGLTEEEIGIVENTAK